MKLKCFKKIKLSNVEVKRRSFSVDYIIDYDDVRRRYKLIGTYVDGLDLRKYGEIASFAGIIPAINYALFADEIEISYPIHDAEYEFLRDMVLITAGDILVNRIVKPTRLVKDEYRREVDRYDDLSFIYETLAEVNVKETFSGTSINHRAEADRAITMVSGGKDSLLSYSLLNEIGLKVYPVFINEAGMHWLTAYTAYKYFAKNIRGTIRIWTNIDRLFTFIEKSMKIVTPYYWRKNRDIYPIRLLWYPYYISLSLPYAIEYNVGNITMGNEYDDPAGLEYVYKGVRHYYATYDQSQECDKYMSAWYKKRGLDLNQWSPIRPITGLIVERILYNRYPAMFMLQTSCHSSHKEGGTIYPCGICRKDTGIIIFLLANGIDPRLLRYRRFDEHFLQYQIARGNYSLDTSELEHSLYLINKRYGWSLKPAAEHWHVESIQFDPINSHLDNVPCEEYRDKLLDIFEEYTNGYAVLYDGRERVKVDRASLFNFNKLLPLKAPLY